MSRHKFICFDCQFSVKRDLNEGAVVKCPSCGNLCTYIGVKIPVPPKSKPKEWVKLRQQLSCEIAEVKNKNKKHAVAKKHDLEKEIVKLELLPINNGRLSLIKKLKKQLAQYNA